MPVTNISSKMQFNEYNEVQFEFHVYIALNVNGIYTL